MKKWPTRPLGEVARVLSGATPRTGVPDFWNGDIVWLTPKDLGTLQGIAVRASERSITRAGFESCSAKMVPPGSVVMSSRAPIGHLAINTVPVCTNQGCKSFVPGETINVRFLYWTLKVVMPEIQHMGQGCTFEEVSKTDLEGFPIPLPPLAEQRRIVARVQALTHRLDQARQARQAALAEAETVFRRALENEFADEVTEDWREVPPSNLFQVVSGQFSPLDPKLKHLPYLGPEHVESGTGRIIGERVSVEELKMKSGKYLFSPEHVVYSKIRPALRKVCLPDYTGLCSADMYALKPNTEEVTREFLMLLLLAPPFSEYAVDNSDRNAMPKINREALFGFMFRVPDKKEQERIAKLLLALRGKLDELQRLQREVETELAAFTSALLAKAFRGEL